MKNVVARLSAGLTAALLLAGASLAADGAWTVDDRENDELPGRRIDLRQDGERVASLVYGEGQFKPYLAVYGPAGERLTNPGLDAAGAMAGLFPHHRGIFIGWNHIDSELGRDDLWHLRGGEHMKLVSIDSAEGDENGARLAVTIEWRSKKADAEGSRVLLVETRRFHVTRDGGRTIIDTASTLRAARDVRLGGDLQHAGIHFRADHAVSERKGETSYLWEPADAPDHGGKVVSAEMKWVKFLFPLGDRWYAVTQINPPSTPVQELSWRDYGRFGFFFTAELAAGETKDVAYRFLVEPAEAPADGAKHHAAQVDGARQQADAYYRQAIRHPGAPR